MHSDNGTRSQMRASAGVAFFADLMRDFGYALRQLGRNPGFALTAILTLTLGIGATTAVFSVAYGVLIDPFPYRDVHTLVTPKLCSAQVPQCYWNIYTPEQFNELVQKTDVFDGVTASTISNVVLTGGNEPLRLRGNYITANTFVVLGVRPMYGRGTTAEDVQPGHGQVALLSYRYWKAHFGGDLSVLGRVLMLNGRARTVIGIMPPRFLWRGGDVYLPIDTTQTSASGTEVEGQSRFAMVARMKPGVTEAKAASELQLVFQDFARTAPTRFPKDLRVGTMPFDQMFKSGLAGTLYLLLGAVVVLLLIACVNVSSLLLARAVQREHEFVVRASIGASRSRLVRHALAESLLLAMVAMPAALGFAYAGLQAMLRIVPVETIPDEAVVTMNVPVLLASMGIALATVMLFGLAPAWHSANPRLAAALGSVRSSGSRAQRTSAERLRHYRDCTFARLADAGRAHGPFTDGGGERASSLRSKSHAPDAHSADERALFNTREEGALFQRCPGSRTAVARSEDGNGRCSLSLPGLVRNAGENWRITCRQAGGFPSSDRARIS